MPAADTVAGATSSPPGTECWAAACLVQTILQEGMAAQVLQAGCLFCYLDKPPVLLSIPPACGVQQHRNVPPRQSPSCNYDLNYAAKQRPVFWFNFPPVLSVIVQKASISNYRSDSQLMWYSGRPELLLLWQWSSAHLFCR